MMGNGCGGKTQAMGCNIAASIIGVIMLILVLVFFVIGVGVANACHNNYNDDLC
jgi:preprotein translocase subunit SecG